MVMKEDWRIVEEDCEKPNNDNAAFRNATDCIVRLIA